MVIRRIHYAQLQSCKYSQISHTGKRPPWKFEKVVATTAGCLGEWTLISNCMVKQKGVVAYESFRNSLIIHKENLNKGYLCLMSVFISDVDTAKNYVNVLEH